MNLVIILFILTSSTGVIASFIIQLVNQEVNTYIDVSTQVAFVSRKIHVENVDSVVISNYTYIIDSFWAPHLSYIEAVDGQGTYLKVVRDYSTQSQLRYKIAFDYGLYPNSAQTLSISTVFVDIVQNQPRKIKQHELHSVLFKFNIYFYSKYFTTLQTTVLYTGANKVSYVDGAKFKLANDSYSKSGLQYGPYHNLHAKSKYISSVNYEAKTPFLVVEKLSRFIQISHWGFVRITDRVSLLHAGPKLEGPYERPFQQGNPDVTRIQDFVSTLPRHAFDIYLRDDIGMISSFTVDDSDETRVEVNIRPRFVLYGGWKTDYELSYSLPVQPYLLHADDTFTLTLPLLDRVFPHLVVRDADVNLALPEGASFLSVDPGVDLENNSDHRYCYVFDTVCREVVSFKMHNLFHRHCDTEVHFTYVFSQYLLLSKPLTVAGFVFFTLLLALSVSRLCSGDTCEQQRSRRAMPDPLLRQTKSESVIFKNPIKYVNNRPKKHAKVNRK